MGGVGGRPVGKLVTSKRRIFVQRPEKKKESPPPHPDQEKQHSGQRKLQLQRQPKLSSVGGTTRRPAWQGRLECRD